MKTCFSEEKLMKQFGNSPLSKRTHPPLSTNPLFLSNFFMTPLFVQISKTRSPLILGGGNYEQCVIFSWSIFSCIQTNREIYCKSPISVQILENTDPKKLRIWTFFTQCYYCKALYR